MPRLNSDSSRTHKRRRWLLLPLALLAVPIALKILGIEPVNRANTSADNADASLRTRIYESAPPDVLAQVLVIVPALSTYGQSWRVMDSDPGLVKCEVPVLVFTDDVTITITPEGQGSRVDVTSASRVGQGDMGENARHIRQLLSALDERLPSAR